VTRASWNRLVCGVGVTLAISACASASQGPARGSGNVITREELEAAPTTNAFDALQRLRPQWISRPRASTLQPGGNPVIVFVDRTQFGTLESLRSLNTDQIERMEFVAARDATTRYGTGYPSGIVEVTTRRR
jgi:hypothetical protein